jgi:HK97 family phage major capsid protein
MTRHSSALEFKEADPLEGKKAEELAAAITAEFKQTYTELNKKHEDIAQVIDEIKKKAANKADFSDLDNRLKGMTDEVKKLSVLADDIDKRMSRGGAGGQETKSLGQTIVEGDEFKAWAAEGGGRKRINLDTKATLLTSNIALPAINTFWGVPRQLAELLTVNRKPLTMRDLIPTIPTNSNAVDYLKWTRAAMSAAPVAEGALKPESAITIPVMTTVPIRTIAHIIYQSKQLMDDSPAFQAILDQEMRRGVLETEDTQILLGDGTGQNLFGIIPQAPVMAQSQATNGVPGVLADVQTADLIRWGKLKVTQAYYPCDTVLLNPQDWAKIELMKDAQKQYLFSAFTSGVEPRLWGLRVKEDFSIPVGRFLVGAFSTGAKIWDRQQLTVELSTENKDNFEKNMITIRAEERIAVAVERPESFQYGFTTAIA